MFVVYDEVLARNFLATQHIVACTHGIGAGEEVNRLAELLGLPNV